jgi:hypothetical protein
MMTSNENALSFAWYYIKDGKQFGPTSLQEISNLVQFGEIDATDKVRPEGNLEWIKVHQIEGLLSNPIWDPSKVIIWEAQPLEPNIKAVSFWWSTETEKAAIHATEIPSYSRGIAFYFLGWLGWFSTEYLLKKELVLSVHRAKEIIFIPQKQRVLISTKHKGKLIEKFEFNVPVGFEEFSDALRKCAKRYDVPLLDQEKIQSLPMWVVISVFVITILIIYLLVKWHV